jgi:hypothetical protein
MRSAILAGAVTWCVLASASVVVAGDYCIHETPGDQVIVLKSASLPAKGSCKSVRGFFQSGAYFTNGTACGSTDGTSIRFILTTLIPDTLVTENFALLRSSPTTVVSGRECDTDGSNCADLGFAQTACNPKNVPVPQ